MKTKDFTTAVAAILVSFLMINFGCNKNSSTGPGSSQALGNGSDYLPLSSDQTLSGKATAQEIMYDSTGKIVESSVATNEDVHGYIGLAGTQGYPLYGYAQDGVTLVPSNVVVAEEGGAVMLITELGQKIVLLPKNLSVGAKWVANPFYSADSQVTLQITDGKSSYTNSAGKTFSNVIEINGSYSDSAVIPHAERYYYSDQNWWSSNGTEVEKLKASIDFYFAKGIGIVDVKLNQFDFTVKSTEVDSDYNYNSNPPLQVYHFDGYLRAVASATCGRTDSPGASVAQKVEQGPTVALNLRTNPGKIRLIDLLLPKHIPHFRRLGTKH